MTTTTAARRTIAAEIKSAVDAAIVGGEFPALAGCKVRVSGGTVGWNTTDYTGAETG